VPIPTRIDDDVFAAAKASAAEMSRSAAQQINHWARIGRELEATRGITLHRIREVLGGGARYDELDDEGQAVVRATWTELVEGVRSDLNLAAEFTAQGRPYVELDDEGQVVRRTPRPH
jgi:hypothetical protein